MGQDDVPATFRGELDLERSTGMNVLDQPLPAKNRIRLVGRQRHAWNGNVLGHGTGKGADGDDLAVSGAEQTKAGGYSDQDVGRESAHRWALLEGDWPRYLRGDVYLFAGSRRFIVGTTSPGPGMILTNCQGSPRYCSQITEK